ncbi:tyrosine-type recombinase/integrase [Thermodesulfobacteriota bacterium]
MAILIECPDCKTRKSTKTKKCDCGKDLKKATGKTYWIEYYLNGRRKRERIGTSKLAAENRLREVLKNRAEERYIDKDKNARFTLGDLCEWYLDLPEVKAKASFKRDENSIAHLRRILHESTRINDLTPGAIESYRSKRLSESSPRRMKSKVAPATVNRELACLKSILNRAVRHGKIDYSPIRNVKMLPENNVRERILSQEEFNSLMENCPRHLAPVVLTAFYTGMRKAEIIHLTWDEVDPEKGFIRLSGKRTKTKQGRIIPMHPRVTEVLQELPQGLHTRRVFLRRGKPFDDIKNSFRTACENAKIEDFTFHDLRHCALNNLRLAGNDYFKIMAMSGHKTTSVFKRYNLVTEEELTTIKWHDQKKKKDDLNKNRRIRT